MRDGLYRVATAYLCAGFMVEGGLVTRCAPILRARIAYWATVAVPVDPSEMGANRVAHSSHGNAKAPIHVPEGGGSGPGKAAELLRNSAKR